MRKLILVVFLVVGVSSVAQAKELPEICQTMFEMMRANAIDAGDQEAADTLDMETIRSEWAKLSDSDQQSYTAECQEMVEMMKQIRAAQ